MSETAVIFGLSGPILTSSEAVFFRDSNPWAFILFARNVETPEQLRRLTSDLRACVGRDCLIFIDQEGGRVQRLRPPHWTNYPAVATYGRIYEQDPERAKRACFLHHRLIADDLRAVGVNADCSPVLDLPQPDADPIISDRAFSTTVEPLIDLAKTAMAGLITGGVAPVIKHIPGHGRATVDSHKALPTITASREELDATDFKPFLAFSDAPMAMTAHAVYTSSDTDAVTVSRKAMTEIIRAALGFDGLVMSDDLDMKALEGTLEQKTRRALLAGCDIALQCSGALPDMVQVAKGARALTGRSKERADAARLCAKERADFDRKQITTEFESLIAEAMS